MVELKTHTAIERRHAAVTRLLEYDYGNRLGNEMDSGVWVVPYREPILWKGYTYKGTGYSDPVLDAQYYKDHPKRPPGRPKGSKNKKPSQYNTRWKKVK